MSIQTIEDVFDLFSEISRYGLLDTHSIASTHSDGVNIRFFTDNNEYRISALLPGDEKPRGYLGCIASCRKPRAGEDWTRGNDLPDGSLAIETWHAILASIVSYEMVKVHRQPMHPKAMPAEPSGQSEPEAA